MRSSTSPFRGTGSDNIHIIVEKLQNENTTLVDEIKILKTKSRKVADLEERI